MRPPLTPSRVAAALAAARELYGVTPAVVLGRSQSRGVVPVRHAVVAALHEACEVSSLELGRRFERDHTTILYSIAAARGRAARDAEYAAALALIAHEIARA